MRRMTGGVIPPTTDELKDIAKKYRFTLDDEQAKWFQGLIDGSLGAYRRLGQLPDDPLEVKYPRTPGYTPEAAENKYNAWARKCSVKGAPTGKLAGKKIVVKDPICVAGVPMAAGSAVVENFVPDIANGTAVSLTTLLSQAANANAALTFTCAPPGNGSRIGVDRDGDNILDRNDTN